LTGGWWKKLGEMEEIGLEECGNGPRTRTTVFIKK